MKRKKIKRKFHNYKILNMGREIERETEQEK